MAKGVAAFLVGWVAALFFKKFCNWNAVFYCATGMAFLSAMLILILRTLAASCAKPSARAINDL
ncbi:MAG: hypothetical protein LAO78_04715 [Acidobacteriia bacterium]|nr:hypothetical protein [Terriglobia bacterium]